LVSMNKSESKSESGPVERSRETSASQRRVAVVVGGALKAAHEHAASAPIIGPDERGAFPSAWRPGPFGGVVPPVVVDANVLRNDVRYACEQGRRTVLVTAANSGAIRLFAASHVIEEIWEHAERWAQESGAVSAAQFRERFSAEYLPLIRMIADGDLQADLLAREERVRVEWLAQVDPDDVPSVILALVLEAFFLSEDGRALRAVYGERVDRAAHHAWVERLKAGGNACELGKLIFAAGAIPMAAGAGLFAGGRWIAERYSPWALAPLGLGIAALFYLKPPPPQTRAKIGTSIGEYVLAVGHAYIRYLDAYKEFGEATPPVPDLAAPADASDGDGLLRRAVMHKLARAPSGRMSAAELATGLRQPGDPPSEVAIEKALRGGGLSRPYAGQWQLGAAGSVSEVVRTDTVAVRARPPMPLPGMPTPQRIRATEHPMPFPRVAPARRR
jgi:predicted nucleic acid-binding protein